ncbi:membrane protein [Clostridium sp. L74]|nr:membrane protein [Clostridium sp. L74]
MFNFIKGKLRKVLEEKFVLSAYLLTIIFLFIVNLIYNLGKKIGLFIMMII